MTIQFFDENGEPATEPLVFEESIWFEGQLSDEELSTITSLEVGEVAAINSGWTVKRLS